MSNLNQVLGTFFFYGAYQGCIYLIKNGYYCEKMVSMLIYFIIMQFIPIIAKLNFQHYIMSV